jgi:hypothetical protein
MTTNGLFTNCSESTINNFRHEVEHYIDAMQRYVDEANRYADKAYDYAQCEADAAAQAWNSFINK